MVVEGMLETFLLFILAGCILGTIAGLTPGLHVNTIAMFVLAFAAHGDLPSVLLIASMSVVQTFVDFVPSVLLGAPSNETFLSVLPGHRMLLQGKGLFAIQLTIIGGLAAGLMAVAAGPLFAMFLRKGEAFFPAAIPFVLGTILLMMAIGEKRKNMLLGIAVILLSGLLGVAVLRGSANVANALFCLMSGFFGASGLIKSVWEKQKLCEQKTTAKPIGKARAAKQGCVALFGGALVALMPAISCSEAAFVIRKIVGKIRTSDYLILLGGINTSNMILSFFTLFALGKTRTGSAVAMKQLLDIGTEQLLFIAAACLIGIGFGAIATVMLARAALRRIHLLDYKKINAAILVFLTAAVFAFSGTAGLLAFGSATAIGLLTVCSGVRRTNCMAFLIIPTLLFYLGV
ncbi:MAG: tripartite tricarboxylate transporter permease [Candidatus Diapherotrites archaeon]|nr:tripartite tricarboxylate transporter permease [Candidatus Diapherotrites archaeon]